MALLHRMAAPVLGAAVAAGCADLTFTPDQVPDTLVIAPADTVISVGDQAHLRIEVLDRNREPMPGPPAWAPPRWTVSEPETLAAGPDGRFDSRHPGQVHVRASVADFNAVTRVFINPSSVVLSAPTLYLVQAVQNLAGDVPLIAGREALLRVFATGDQPSFFRPRARATFFLGGEEIHTAWMDPEAYLTPVSVREGRLDLSYNARIPGHVLQPGIEMVAELDPDGIVPLASGSRTRVPASGRLALDVRSPSRDEFDDRPGAARGRSGR